MTVWVAGGNTGWWWGRRCARMRKGKVEAGLLGGAGGNMVA
jgi:hypothetical protein